jgi:hypothetical protein
VEILDGQEHWDHMIDHICQPAAHGSSVLRHRIAFTG